MKLSSRNEIREACPGLSESLALARSGRAVEVYENKSKLLPSSGPHTEGIRNYGRIDALQELRAVGFDIEPFGVVRRTIRFSANFRNVLHGPAYYLFMRGREGHTVDQILYQRAKEDGVEFHFGQRLEPSEADIVATGPPKDRFNILGAGYTFNQILYQRAKEDGVEFHFGQRLEPSEADIVATGPPKDRFNILGAGYTFTEEGSHIEVDVVRALLDNEVAPGGYLVITPGIKTHSIYSVSWSELRFDRLLGMTEAAFKIPWIRAVLGTSRRVSKINGRAFFTRDPIDTAVRGGSLYVGEAGGFQDAIAGFGFRYAVLTAALAARANVEGHDYRELLKEKFGDEFRKAYDFREWLNRTTNDDFDKLIAAMGSEVTLEDYLLQRGSRAI